MGGRGAESSGGGTGLNSDTFFSQDMMSQITQFEQVLNAVDQNLTGAISQYASGMVGGDKKAQFDDENGISDFIDSDASKSLRLSNNPTLYRGGTITDDELANIKVGDSLDTMDSKGQLTSWSDREMVAHMYAEESSLTWGQGGDTPRDIIIVDNSKTSDAIVMPYTYPQNEVLRSKNKTYTVTKIVHESEYTEPIGRGKEFANDSYKSPVTYIYVTSKKPKKSKKK